MRIRRVLPASCEGVFDAWLNAGGMCVWICPGPVIHAEVTLEPRVAGTFRILMKAPHAEIVNTGEFRVLERPSRLQFTWVSSRWNYEETLVTVELAARDRDCELTLIHERFPREHSAERLLEGWNQMLEKLGEHLVTAHRG